MFLLIGIVNLLFTIRTRTWFVMFIFLSQPQWNVEAIYFQNHHAAPPWQDRFHPYASSSGCITHLFDTGRLQGSWTPLEGCQSAGRVSEASVDFKDLPGKRHFGLLIQTGGAGMASSSNPITLKTAKNLLLLGLAIQLVFFGIFTCITVYVNLRQKYCLRELLNTSNVYGACTLPSFCCLYVISIASLSSVQASWVILPQRELPVHL